MPSRFGDLALYFHLYLTRRCRKLRVMLAPDLPHNTLAEAQAEKVPRGLHDQKYLPGFCLINEGLGFDKPKRSLPAPFWLETSNSSPNRKQ